MLRLRAGSLVTLLVLAPACAASPPPKAAATPATVGDAPASTGTAATPTTPGATHDRTVVDRDGLSFELPGEWQGIATKDGYEWRRGNDQQVITAFMPAEGAPSLKDLAAAQRQGLAQVCKRGTWIGESQKVMTAGVPWIRTPMTCEDPPVAAVLGAALSNGRLLSFEQYRYSGSTLTKEIERSTNAVLDSVRIQALAVGCPADILASAKSDGGACLESAVLGDAVVKACVHDVEAHHWTRDDAAAKLIGKQTGKTLVCYRAPAN